MERALEILHFWFGDIDADTEIAKGSELPQRWFRKDKKFDQEIKTNFLDDLKKARVGEYDQWDADAQGRLALVLIFDQFPRNIYRDSPKAYENDLKALEYTLKSFKDGLDKKLMLIERQFLYMPLMHSEHLEVQKESVRVFEKLAKYAHEIEDPSVEHFDSVVQYAKKHHDVIEEFGRFPHRNEILKRRSTSEEQIFLTKEGSSF